MRFAICFEENEQGYTPIRPTLFAYISLMFTLLILRPWRRRCRPPMKKDLCQEVRWWKMRERY